MTNKLLSAIFVLLLIIIGAEAVFIFSFGKKEKVSQEKGFLLDSGKTAALGYYSVSDDGSLLSLVAKLDKVYQSEGKILAEFSTDDNQGKKVKQTFLLAEEKDGLKFYLIRQKGYDFYPTSDKTTFIPLDYQDVKPSLSKYSGKTIKLLVSLSLPQLKPSQINEQVKKAMSVMGNYLPCNQAFYNKVKAAAENKLPCLPRTGQIYVVD